MDRQARSELELERLGVDGDVRELVLERDASCCRVCGRHVEDPALHHIVFRSQGGLDIPSNLITIGWLPQHNCHGLVHGTGAREWRELLLDLTGRSDWVTGLQLMRWKHNDSFRDRLGRRVI